MAKVVGVFFASRTIGGGELLFLNAIKILIGSGFKVVNIDFDDGFIREHLRTFPDEIQHLTFDENSFNDYTKFDIDIVMTSAGSIRWFQRDILLKPDTLMFFWSISPYNFIEYLRFSLIYKYLPLNFSEKISKIFEKKRVHKISNYLSVAMRNDALFFMDYQNFFYTRLFFYFDNIPKYLPIVFNNSLGRRNNSNGISNNHCRITWMSRLEKYKVQSLIVLVKELSVVEFPEITFEINIIGSGTYRNKLEEILKRETDMPINYLGILTGEERDLFLTKNTDLYFGMGTSVLDAAALGIPSAFVSSLLFNVRVSRQKFIWAYETIGFDLILEKDLYTNPNSKSLGDLLIEYFCNANYIGDKCAEYVSQNHNIHSVEPKLLMALSNTSFSYREFVEQSPPVHLTKLLLRKFIRSSIR